MIQVDKGAPGGTKLATCSRCPSFRVIRFTTADAWVAGLQHAREVHTMEAERRLVRRAEDATEAAIRRG